MEEKDFQNIKGIAIREVIINDVRLTRDSETETREKKIPIDIAAVEQKVGDSLPIFLVLIVVVLEVELLLVIDRCFR